MDLWLEYLVRRNLSQYIPIQETSTHVRVYTYATDQQLWAYFMQTYSGIMGAFDPALPTFISRSSTINDQQVIIFNALPCLASVWNCWACHNRRVVTA